MIDQSVSHCIIEAFDEVYDLMKIKLVMACGCLQTLEITDPSLTNSPLHLPKQYSYEIAARSSAAEIVQSQIQA